MSFVLIQVYVVPMCKHLTLTDVYVWQIVTSVGISYELQKKERVVEGEFLPYT